MTKLETAFANILGVKPTYMRPPSGDSGGQTVSVMQQLGYRIVKWDIDSEDWNNKTPVQSEAKFTAASSGSHIPCMCFSPYNFCSMRGLGAIWSYVDFPDSSQAPNPLHTHDNCKIRAVLTRR